MSDIFLEKLSKNEYISTFIYQNTDKQNIPEDFDLDKYNNEILNKEYLKHKDYFDNMYKGIDDNIHLDEEQAKAILADEDYSLIIAGAGTGKTTTMASKVKYLVDIKHILPERIVVMSYTKKATEELEKRIVDDFGIPARVTTFHSLGYAHIKEIFPDRKCFVVDENLRNELFYLYFKEKIFPDKSKTKELIDSFEKLGKSYIGRNFRENYTKYDTFDEYFDFYKQYKLDEITDHEKAVKHKIDRLINLDSPLTIKNELVKSKGEAIIANFLYMNGIDYTYEKIYSELMNDRTVYKPDFTLNIGGEEVYLEYFGLSNYNSKTMRKYEKIRKMKEDYHEKNHTRFIKLDYYPGERLEDTLRDELTKMGFVLKPRTYTEILSRMLDNNPMAQLYKFRDFVYEVIDTIKSFNDRGGMDYYVTEYVYKLAGEERETAIKQWRFIRDFYVYYQKELYGAETYGFDYSDMIYYANKYIDKISKNSNLHYDYLIIDEYQDISQERYEFAKRVADKNHAKVVAVGDDWQAIYAFAGSRIQYIYNFELYFRGAKRLKITRTYRNSQELINYSGKFIMKNEDQIYKELVSSKHIENPIKFLYYNDGEEYAALKKLIKKLYEINPSHKILILARYNYMISNIYNDPDFIDDIDTKIKLVGFESLDIDGMSIHKSKGLTSDEVIIIGLNNSFPSPDKDNYWLISLFKNKSEEESIEFAEERRLFYVALTRTKNYVYLLANKDIKKRSPFITELCTIVKED